ncbi:MAG: DUF2029 domain-containing protein [Ignavibacteriae bacterium]|nr:DUF2029 domain-containing protein [Ignavibacteriota bacterium]
MAKTVTKKVQPAIKNVKSIEEYIDKYFWIVIPLFAVIYYMSSRYSTGFYQYDEVAQYINMLDFWKDPWAILGNAPKPGYKIFMVLPAFFGYDTVLFVNSLIASLTVYLTFKLIKLYEIKYAFFGALLLAAQPTFFDISFRSYPEIFTALLFVIFLILYKKEYYLWSALLVGFIFTVRQEIALLGIILTLIFIKEKRFKEIIALAVFPLIYNFLGYLMKGDWLYVYSEMRNISAFEYKMEYPKFYHYAQTYIFVVGPVSFLLFMQGFFSFFADKPKMKEYFKKYFLFYVIFILIMAVHTGTMLIKANPGNWRYILHISPICAFFATIGLNNLIDTKFKKYNYVITGIVVLVTFAFLSRTTDGRVLTDVSDYTKVLFLLIAFAVYSVFSAKIPNDYLNKVSVLLFATAVIYLGINFKPKVLGIEDLTVKNATEQINVKNFKDRNFYTNHPLVKYYSNDYKNDPSKFQPLNSRTLSTAPKGSIMAWDTHFGYRPDSVWKCDIKLEFLQDTVNYRLLNLFPSSDKRFALYFFEKLN